MNKKMAQAGSARTSPRGFTLIELLVVVAVIALLVSILLPSLGMARAQAKAVKCAANIRGVGTAMALYLAQYKGMYPPSYLYPHDDQGNYNLQNQSPAHPHGYLHWSHFLFSSGKVNAELFECPSLGNGGCPRTNPGAEGADWEPNQVDQNNNGGANPLQDKQAPRMAYTVNAAICPRNKFTTTLSGGPRINKFVSEAAIRQPGTTILATEFHRSWLAAAVSQGGNGPYLSKSHRPITAFYSISSGADEYAAPKGTKTFVYGSPSDPQHFGLLETDKLEGMAGLINGDVNGVELNAVGRHHPGADGAYYGTANFLFCDGHVDRRNVLDTLINREWGDHYYSLTGENVVLGPGVAVASN